MGRSLAGLMIVAALGGLGCRKPALLKPAKPVPPGEVLIQFTRVVKSDLELSIDGTRIPVAIARKGGRHLRIKGLAAGKHTYFLASATHAFGPDQGQFEVGPDQGVFLTAFSQTFKAVLYGSGDPLPAATGLPGVKATLEP